MKKQGYEVTNIGGIAGYKGRMVKSVSYTHLDVYKRQILSWADEIRTLKVRTNADNPRDAKQAAEFGAEGIGLCRTEHMFFEEERIPAIRRMIMASTKEERKNALELLLPYQKSDFKGIYEAMGCLLYTSFLLFAGCGCSET